MLPKLLVQPHLPMFSRLYPCIRLTVHCGWFHSVIGAPCNGRAAWGAVGDKQVQEEQTALALAGRASRQAGRQKVSLARGNYSCAVCHKSPPCALLRHAAPTSPPSRHAYPLAVLRTAADGRGPGHDTWHATPRPLRPPPRPASAAEAPGTAACREAPGRSRFGSGASAAAPAASAVRAPRAA